MKEHRARLDERLIAHGRSPRAVGCLWSVRVQLGESEEDALEIERRYIEKFRPRRVSSSCRTCTASTSPSSRNDMKISEVADQVKSENVHWGSFQEIVDTADPDMTIGEVGRKNAIGKSLVVRGTPENDRRPARNALHR